MKCHTCFLRFAAKHIGKSHVPAPMPKLAKELARPDTQT